MGRPQQPFTVGLTGGIGAGKTTVSHLFEEMGIEVIDTDMIAREIVLPGSPVLDSIEQEFSPRLLRADGSLDRTALRRIVFNDAAKRRRLESITHPAIRDASLRRLSQVASPYAILVVPLLFETGFDRLVNRVLVIDALESEQIERVMRRDGSDLELIQRMIGSQMSRRDRLARADDILNNQNNASDLAQQTNKLHRAYLKMAASEP